jgi:hypothetical protein
MASSNSIQQELLSLVRGSSANSPLANPPALVTAPVSATLPGGPPDTMTLADESDAKVQLARELDLLRRQLGTAEEAARRQAELLEQNTRAVVDAGNRGISGAASLARDIVSPARDAGAFGALASPLAGVVNWLLRRGNNSGATAELPQASSATPINANFGLSLSGPVAPATYRADGLPRQQIPSQSPVAPASITVQVNTMDSRSFMDNSDQIARAVREAMLNSHSLNDVIGEM